MPSMTVGMDGMTIREIYNMALNAESRGNAEDVEMYRNHINNRLKDAGLITEEPKAPVGRLILSNRESGVMSVAFHPSIRSTTIMIKG